MFVHEYKMHRHTLVTFRDSAYDIILSDWTKPYLENKHSDPVGLVIKEVDCNIS